MTEKIVSGAITPSRKQIALQLTCAIASNSNINFPPDPREAADVVLDLLNHLEERLSVARTPVRSGA